MKKTTQNRIAALFLLLALSAGTAGCGAVGYAQWAAATGGHAKRPAASPAPNDAS